MQPVIVRFVALLITALSLAPSLAHVLEAPPRMSQWSPHLWRETTVFNGQYRIFGIFGAPLDIGAVLATALLAYLSLHRGPAWPLALAGAILYALALTAWLLIVMPANGVLATWKPGPLPENLGEVRDRWEYGHMLVASLKFLGFISITLSVLLWPESVDEAD